MSDSIWYKLGKATGKGLVYLALAVATAGLSTLFHNDDVDDDYDEENPVRKTTGAPKLPADLFSKIYDRDGHAEAVRILDKVQRDEMSVEDVRTALNRPDIDPKDWRDFEDGWRPKDW